MVTDKYTIRKQNEALLLETIILEKEISRAELSLLTGLNKATVSEITKKLIETELIKETRIGTGSIAGGRKPIMLEFNAQAGCALAIDLGNDYLTASLSYLNGQVIDKLSYKIKITAHNVVDLILETVRTLNQKCPNTTYSIVGMTLAIHGIVDNQHILLTPNYDLDQIELYEALRPHFLFPIYLENEANLTAIAEASFSTSVQNLVSISIHSGIGAGIILDGQLFKGRNGYAGEIGHLNLFPDGLECPCGNRGCLEQYASEKALLHTLAKKNNASNLTDLQYSWIQKESETVITIKKIASYLSIGIHDVMISFAPEMIFLNGPIFQVIPELLGLIQANLNSAFTQNVTLVESSLCDKATLYGGIAVATRNFLNIKQLHI